jgi:hypothetical protein
VSTPTVSGSTYTALNSVSALASNDIWAVGTSNAPTAVPLAEHWNGSAWSLQSPPLPSGDPAGVLNHVTAIGPNNVMAVGDAPERGAGVKALIEQWDGSTWQSVDGANIGELYAVVPLSQSNIWILGAKGIQLLLDHVCPVVVSDSSVTPSTVTPAIGQTVVGVVQKGAAATHQLVDPTGLVDTGPLAPGAGFAMDFPGSGIYTITDEATSAVLTATVAPTIVPSSGVVSTSFSITWADGPPPSGFGYDLQIERPGTTTFTKVLSGSTASSTTFVPDSGTGTYFFRARVRQTSTGNSTGWSRGKIVVS